MINRVFLSPIAETSTSLDGPVTSSWGQQLSEAGFSVTQRHFGWQRNALDYVSGHGALILPSSVFDGGAGESAEEPAGMSFDTVHALRAAINHGIPIFSERPIAVSFQPLSKSFSGEPLISDFAKIVDYELGETIIGHDLSIIQKELGAS